ncbi:hypothetical protein BJY01DRAFT_245481 [Aspergillus pseudoustus]|uniref:Fungal N-terminal domain-containing protein n=1 Tax=Aspergillus pseudoustus TaxID=1810923 RepID=A0ABR4KDF9_9EURO
MEALAAFSLAGTIIQVVDFSSKVLTTTHELYKATGNVTIFQQCELVTTDLYKISKHLQNCKAQSISNSYVYDVSLQALLTECSDLASKLLARFEKLRVRGKKTKYKTFSQALKSVFSESDIQSIMRQLAEMRAAIQTHLIVDLRAQLDTLISTGINNSNIDQTTRELIVALSSHQDKMETQGVAISQLLGKVDLIAQDQAITLVALAKIDKAKATASTKTIQQSSFLDNIAGFKSERGAYQRVADSGQDLQSQVTSQLIGDLSFPAIEYREDAIIEAHRETFRWIFSDQFPPARSFVNWLRRGGGVYWINGKAGSGKSTLMKYIFQQPDFHSLLK